MPADKVETGMRGKRSQANLEGDYGDSFMNTEACQNFELCTFNILSLYRVNYTSIKLLRVSCCPIETCLPYNKKDWLRLESVIGIMGQRA